MGGRPRKYHLDDWKTRIEQWAKDGLRRSEILHRLKEQGNVDVGDTTLYRQMRAWGIRYHNAPIEKTDALRERIKEIFHTQPGLSDEHTLSLLQDEGFQISGSRALSVARRESGLMKRIGKDREDKITEDIKAALRNEYGDNYELPEDMSTRNLMRFLRSKYNIVGRDRIRRIAKEINPEWMQRRRVKGQFSRKEHADQPSHTNTVSRNGNVQGVPLENADSSDDGEPDPLPPLPCENSPLTHNDVQRALDIVNAAPTQSREPVLSPVDEARRRLDNARRALEEAASAFNAAQRDYTSAQTKLIRLEQEQRTAAATGFRGSHNIPILSADPGSFYSRGVAPAWLDPGLGNR